MRILYIDRSPIPGKHQQKTQILTDKKYYINISSLSRPLPASVEPLDVLQKNRKSSVGWKHPLRKTLVNHVPHKPLPFTLGILLGTSTHGDGERKATLLDSKDEGHEDVVGGSKGILLRR
jgi:hypothetical protein